MTDASSEKDHLLHTIAALEAQREALGDAVVDTAVAPLRQRLTSLADPSPAAPAIEAERKLVTVLFADLSGFTALSESLDPESVRTIVNRCFNVLVPIVERYGGVVDKFIGDEIMALFGAPVAHENDAPHALHAALEMLEALKLVGARDQVSLGLHVGVNSGTVVTGGMGSDGREQYSVLGDTVNLAARLVDAAPEGAVLVGPLTRRLAGNEFEFYELPAMAVKGKSDPVAVARLAGVRTPAPAWQGLGGMVSELVGREAELGTLIAAVHGLADGEGAVVAVSGEPGIGKSRLVAEARRRTAAEAAWYEGRAQAFGQAMSYRAARSLLSGLLDLDPAAAPAAFDEALRAEVRPLFPDDGAFARVYPFLARLCDVPLEEPLRSALAAYSPEALRTNLRRAFTEFVQARAASGPLVLVWEDLHWADPSSLEIAAALVAATAQAPLLVVAAFRPLEGNAPDWLRRATEGGGAESRVHTIELTPLTPAQSGRLVGNLLHVETLPPDVRRRLLEKAEGNPFFLEELVRALVEEGVLVMQGDELVATRHIDDLDVPDSLQGVVAARIDRLAPDDKRTLQTAAVIGRVFQEPVLAWLVGRDAGDGDLEARLEELARRQLVRRHTLLELIFKHAVTQDVAYHSLLVERRRQLHGRAAEAIETLFPDRVEEMAGALGRHYELAGNPREALGHLVVAAEHAAATYSNEEAIAYYRAAEDAAEEASLSAGADLHERLGRLLALTGRRPEAREEYAGATTLLAAGDQVAHARLRRLVATTHVGERDFPQALAEFAAAEEALGPPPPESDVAWWREWAQIQADHLWLCYWDNRAEEMAELVAETRPVVERVGTPAQRAAMYNALLLMELRRGRYVVSDEMLEYGRAYVAAQAEIGDPDESALAHFMNGFAHLWYGDLDTAQAELEEGLRLARHTGGVMTEARCLTYLTVERRKRGRVRAVRELAAQSAVAAVAAGMPEYTATAKANVAWADWRDGRLPECEAEARAALAQWGELPRGHASGAFKWTALWPLIAVCLAGGRTGDAAGFAAALLGPELMRLPASLESQLEDAVSAWRRGDETSTVELLQEALATARKTGWI